MTRNINLLTLGIHSKVVGSGGDMKENSESVANERTKILSPSTSTGGELKHDYDIRNNTSIYSLST